MRQKKEREDIVSAGSTAVGALVGAATAGTAGAIVGGAIGYLIGTSDGKGKIKWRKVH